MSAHRTLPEEARVSTDPVSIDEGAVLTVDGTEQLLEATLRVLAGRELVELHDEDGNVVATISFRPGFMLRVEHNASAEAAA